MGQASYCVYKHTSPSGKVYIGLTCSKPEIRFKNGIGYKNNDHFNRAILLYGWGSIKHEILRTGLSKDEAERIEIALIKECDSTNQDKGYNIKLGGGALSTHSQETRQKMSEALKGNTRMCGRHHSEATKKKLSDSNRGQVRSNSTRQKMSESAKGKIVSDATKKRMSELRKGKTFTEEHKQRIGAARKGKTQTAECKGRISEANSIPIIQYLKDGQEIARYSSATEAARVVGGTRTHITSCCRGGIKTSCGFIWRYVDEDKVVSK